MPIDSQVEVKQVRLVKGTGSQIAAARQAGEILETDLVVQTDAPDLVTANTAITGATKCKITYDSKGLVTAGADLSSGDITTALGYTPYNSSNPSGYITSITSSDVTTALGYTPYNSSNPNGYTSNVGTVTSVNNVSPVNGNVTLSIPSEVTETTVSGWGFTKNTGTVTSVNNVSPTSGNVTLSIPTDTSDLTNGAGYITSSALSGYQTTANLVTSVSSSSTDTQYPSAKLFYDTVGDVVTLINAL